MRTLGRIAAILVLLGGGVSAQEAPVAKTLAPGGDATVAVRPPDEKRFPEITLSFEVSAADGTPILDARREDFRILESDRPVAITKFLSPISREFVPTTVVLVLDRSESMKFENRMGALKQAVAGFLENLPKGSRVAVVAFGSEVRVARRFTDDYDRVRGSVDDLFPNGGTRFYDAVCRAVELLADEGGRRAIVAMTDGDDNESRGTLDQAMALAKRAGVPVHTIGLGTDRDVRTEDLRDLAEQTGGRPFSATKPEALRGIFEEIARREGRLYSASYDTDRPIQDGTLRPIKVIYKKSESVGETAVYIPGMVVPAAGWSWLFLGLVTALGLLWLWPGSRRA